MPDARVASTYSLQALPDLNQRGAFSIFCDEVRQETTQKLIYIGVYGPTVFVETFPTVLPVFTIVTTVWTAARRPFSKLVYRVIQDDMVLSEDVVDTNEMVASVAKDLEAQGNADDPSRRIQHIRLARFSPFVLERECVLRVRVEVEDGELRTAGLQFARMSPEISGS